MRKNPEMTASLMKALEDEDDSSDSTGLTLQSHFLFPS